MSLKTALTPGQFSHLLSDHSNLIVYYYRQSSVSTDTMASLKDLALRVPSYQFAHVDLEASPVFAQLYYFSASNGIAVFREHKHCKGFAGEDNEFYRSIQDLDKSKMEELLKK
ncbi:hypothetical protein GGI15_004585 [Coemansia interrupta]|uniref:Thioredoxin domain-containing protein n=1 Tax=Coemansia interrupta TaxID=1126814 RepID=A0A9W8LFM3_9FUNG|nr:hypothetical protein GGI15_004585 [Coemansia interrupta]